MGNVGIPELILIFLVILLVFGAKRIPEIARGLGKGIREFKDATHDIKREITISDTPPSRQVGSASQPYTHAAQATQPAYAQPPYPQTPEQAPPPVQHQPGAPPPPAPPTEGQPPV